MSSVDAMARHINSNSRGKWDQIIPIYPCHYHENYSSRCLRKSNLLSKFYDNSTSLLKFIFVWNTFYYFYDREYPCVSRSPGPSFCRVVRAKTKSKSTVSMSESKQLYNLWKGMSREPPNMGHSDVCRYRYIIMLNVIITCHQVIKSWISGSGYGGGCCHWPELGARSLAHCQPRPGQCLPSGSRVQITLHRDQWARRMGGCGQWELCDSRFQRLRLMHDDTRAVLSFRLPAPGSACSDMSRQPGDLTFNWHLDRTNIYRLNANIKHWKQEYSNNKCIPPSFRSI